MPVRALSTSFTVKRALKLGATSYAPGDEVDPATLVSVLGRRLDAYVSRGWLVPTPPQYPETERRANPPRAVKGYHANPAETVSMAAEPPPG